MHIIKPKTGVTFFSPCRRRVSAYISVLNNTAKIKSWNKFSPENISTRDTKMIKIRSKTMCMGTPASPKETEQE